MHGSVRHWRETRGAAVELKFVIDAGHGARIAEWARERLPADPHGGGPFGDEYRITSLYFDTPNHDVLHARGSFARSKYRVRRYDDSDQVFLERKLRRPGLLHKRRTLMDGGQLTQLAQGTWSPGWPGQWFHRRLLARRLEPACELTYRRMARMQPANGSLVRLTVDHDLQVRKAASVEFRPGAGPTHEVLSGHVVLELKFRGDMPAVFKHLVEEFGVTPTGGSKYRRGMAALGHPLQV